MVCPSHLMSIINSYGHKSWHFNHFSPEKLFFISNERYCKKKTFLLQYYGIDFASMKRYCQFCFWANRFLYINKSLKEIRLMLHMHVWYIFRIPMVLQTIHTITYGVKNRDYLHPTHKNRVNCYRLIYSVIPFGIPQNKTYSFQHK